MLRYLLLVLAAAPALATPNVLLLSVDTLRADHLSCYGHEYETSPAIDALAAEGLLFEDAVCEVPLTSPSMGSMLSGRFPRNNGTTRNGLRMPDEVPLVQEEFQKAGYETFCVQSNWTLKGKLSGLDRGFDLYRDDFHEKRWGIVKPERLADDVTDQALEWLENRAPEKPFFAWIHYTDPHAPYEMHKDFNASGKKAWFRSDHERVSIKYDTEIRYTDHHIARFLEKVPEDTVILFVGDHGESLYEHDYLGHGRRIYQMGMHIPLIIKAPGVAAGRTGKPVRGIDVGPTLLGLAGLPKPPSMKGLDLLNDTLPEDRDRVIETYGGAVLNMPGVKDLMAGAEPILQGVISGEWKAIFDGGQAELYHLAEDPMEEQDLAAQRMDIVDELRAKLEAWDAGEERAEQSGEALTEDDLEALRSLGYID
jgi:arylsulfatase A-like enzyme